MLNNITMKQYATVEFETDKDKTSRIIEALANAINNMQKEYPEEKAEQIRALIDLKYMFESIYDVFI